MNGLPSIAELRGQCASISIFLILWSVKYEDPSDAQESITI